MKISLQTVKIELNEDESSIISTILFELEGNDARLREFTRAYGFSYPIVKNVMKVVQKRLASLWNWMEPYEIGPTAPKTEGDD